MGTPDDAILSTVPAFTLDDLVYARGFPPPNFVKIDVEGGEGRVICGAKGVIGEFHPVVVAEVRKSSTWHEVRKLVEPLGYEARFLTPNAEEVSDVLLLPDGHSKGM
jgi:hypothetical protein